MLPSVCFVAPLAYAVLARDRSIGVVGGAEVQQVFIARELARRGHEVSMVCLDYGQPDGIEFDGVRVWRAHRPDEGLPVLRFLHPRLTKLWSAMRRADAQVYYQRNSGALTGIVAAFAKAHGRCAVYASAHDMDFAPDLPLIPIARDRALFRWGMRQVDAVVVQHDLQQRLCRERHGRDATLIRSAYGHVGRRAEHGGLVLWVGSLKPMKQPERFVDLARACPAVRFRMVGGGEPAFVERLKAHAADVPNLEFAGFVPHADVEAEFDHASIFVNTSRAEGFPNTFLQAWSRGMPTVSFIDAGLSVGGRTAGRCVASVDEMASVVSHWQADADAWREAGATCEAAYEANFSLARSVDCYEALFASLCPPPRAGQAGSVQA
jgi:glycosyltransferase involved in cell wall biosynthesis